ncbi:SDR family NAD(P)-dependent oxidoreductase [Chryseobacterium sp. Ch-15]|uniref:SDR family NAD(P)-dependent oxidoreductase n=1 Tax=Chryseobacterium muglaense TaxID=2893752 RepID=A0A9Q3UZ51_9FLAO|nr:SDR family NAD(P)-dependent oxidoreductase [Chryseobacterium muglaense]MBD3903291.1 SDR family NAD(P)-dependent oxidoreductase [Chryseobacterium muglaense]MCC9036121.1 SDR family NAD(P)-dependent oxidoreductase [Chryseobacterium muglaense]MCM2553303.1 SDR family NAD(P)-dependent oxidoreductase [Chryseobacterium muglaense]
MKISQNTIFISGGSAGIGLAIAKKLSEAGNKIIINGRNKERLQNALKELPNAIAIQGDLSLKEDRIRIATELKTNFPQLNIVVNNAGAAALNDLSDSKNNAAEKAYQEINTNYISVIDFTALVLPQLLAQEDAAIVNVSSIAVYRGNKYLPTYSASKAALHSYTQGLRDTFAENEKLNVYEVYPPLVNTEFSAEIGGANGIPASEVADELFVALEKNQFEVPVGETKKIHALAEEISNAVNA